MSVRSKRLNFNRLSLDIGPLGEDSSSDEEDTPLVRANADEFEDDVTPGYVVINWVAIAGHLISFMIMIVYIAQYGSAQIAYTESYLQWNKVNSTANCTDGARKLNTSTNGEFCVEPTTSAINCSEGECDGLDLGALVISFHVLSFLFQGVAALSDPCNGFLGYKYSDMIQSGKNPLRFVEYSISASIMLICIALLNGVTDINLITSIAVLTAACQLCGLIVEYLDDVRMQWLIHLTGWLQFGCAYGIIFHAYFKAASAVDGVEPPDFVYAIVIALFLLYSSFGFVQAVELFCKTKCCSGCCNTFSSEDPPDDRCTSIGCKPGGCRACCPAVRKGKRCNPIYKEMVYVTLSLGAKLVLGWIIFTNVIMVSRE